MSIKSWLVDATKSLKAEGIDSPRLDAILLLEHVLRRSRTRLLAHQEDKLTTGQIKSLNKLLKQRLERLPIAYIIGKKDFYGHQFMVDERVLIPRANSELVVEWIIDNAPHSSRYLDIGTGSGAIAISIGLARADLEVTASDISSQALQVAKANAGSLGANLGLLKSDLLTDVQGYFDVISANLPYIPTNYRVSPEVHKEPEVAVYSGLDGLDHYRRLSKQINDVLLPGGHLVIEHNIEQTPGLKKIFSQAGFTHKAIDSYVSVFRLSDRSSQH